MTRSPIQSIATLSTMLLLLAACGPEVRDGDATAVALGDEQEPAERDPRVVAADLARTKGSEAATVWFVMASDFQCPACKYWHDTFGAEIERDYVATGKVRFAYVNFPLNQHLNARSASEAAMCAGAQGKFWGMHDRLFATQEAWSAMPDPIGFFRTQATEEGLDIDTWNACLAEDVMLSMIDGDYQRGMQNGVNQTPTFFIGTQVVGGAIPADQLRPILDAAIARAGGGTR